MIKLTNVNNYLTNKTIQTLRNKTPTTNISRINPFFPTVPTCAVQETQSLGQQMLNATVGINGLS